MQITLILELTEEELKEFKHDCEFNVQFGTKINGVDLTEVYKKIKSEK